MDAHDKIITIMPSETILRTKIFAPSPRQNLVTRPRLLNKLASTFHPEIRLALVCAPAGFGKTTIVAEWIASRGKIGAAWLTLDEADNAPIRFWRYVDSALQTIDPRLGESIRPVLYALQPPPISTLLVDLVNDILSAGLEFILVLDDYHVINNESIHEALNFLIDHLPPLAHLVITTRSDPPLQLARRRARGELCELRASDLRFNYEEAVQFINGVMRLGLSVDDVAALESRTEGWIAGLQMAAISLHDLIDPHAFVVTFRGDDRYIADYLLEEVLQRQPVELQQFMLQTSVLDRFNSPLCNALTGRNDSQAVFKALERANLFIIPLDNHREWFRYHHLFANLLQQRLLETEGSAAVLDLRRRASQWHAANGNVVDAVEIALLCEDYEQAVAIIEVSDMLLFMTSELNTLRNWTERIPSTIIAAHPRLNLMACWANHATGHLQQAERYLQLLEQANKITVEDFLDDTPRSRELSPLERSAMLEGSVVRVRIAVDTLDLDKAIAHGEHILPRLVNVPGEPYAYNAPENLRGPVLFCIGLAYEYQGTLNEAARLFAEAETIAWERKNPHIVALSIGHQGEVQAMSGHPEAAQATFLRSLEAARSFPPRSSAFWGLAEVGLGELAYARGDLNLAEAHFQAGVEVGKIWNVWDCLLPGMLGIARLYAARDEWQAAYATLDNLLERTAANALMVRPAVEAQRAEFLLQQGNLQAASKWASSFNSGNPGANRLQWEQNALIVAQIWLEQGKQREAGDLLARLLADAESNGHQQIVQRIRQISRSPQPLRRQPLKTSPPVEPLSERELEVLRLMAEGLSNPEIARKLYLSPNTLKAHAQNIYLKLEVHNRMEAINKARDLNLL